MVDQKDYILNFRKEAEAIVAQQLADLGENQISPETRIPEGKLRHVEAELRNSMDRIIRDAKGTEQSEGLRTELMNFYQDYIQDLANRIEDQ